MSRGEGLLEFLLTYGWVVVLVVIVGGALTYFGIIKPASFFPDKCSLHQNFKCTDFRIDTDTHRINLRLENNFAQGVMVTQVKAQDKEGKYLDCEANTNLSVVTGTRPFNGRYNGYVGWHIPKLQWDDIAIPCSKFLPTGEKVTVLFQVVYYLDDASPAFSHVLPGEMITTPQSTKI
ncbi:MAG: hypothetical protein V1735_00945 [Nanoarchaeota archaeon]